ncbi:restriction endonuclease subunit S [Ureaplasma urealyticum]|uniref:Restriction-modification enzyme MpuUVI S subunit n=1 Tax=Ureaplasma urealyticum serovar 8 str. ATCC 27618 TaxID=626095 RepID=A0ABP2DPC4_UREUR|nr:restriction endonuclease subunit S [Ureaplasma urealyticum]EDU56737.1 restriction-modification enzyme MpuUVI S subunit [Ureaplasma urealyticum serovar 7 str. ATCC 27819]EDY74751.1 restriction-modification enzyme MpuUVI S subunit [Ureaplasma urealyticum serovar 4 str. ATCC 27816]EEH01326.1 restriction-modification enzyme MpuUVI S subunit [Ureaplasma urealyticum serovar 8 str. ATCC 27618]QDI63419.1 restriction endonuclease subunit S [Ureaplasma urealyticum]
MSIKLKDIIYAKRGSTITSNEFKINPGSYPLISASAQNNGVFGYINSYMYEGGHITISMNGNAGCVFYQKDKFSANSDVLVLSNIDNKISNNKFIFYWLKKHENTKIKSLCKGTTRLRLSNDDVLNLEINLPPIEEQNAIISIIEPIEKVINNIKNIKFKIESLVNKYFDFLYSNLEDSNFKKYILGDLFTINRGQIINSKYIESNIGSYPVISSNTKNNGVFGYINSYMYDGEFITISADGAYAGTVFLQNGRFSITNVCFILIKNNDIDFKFSNKFVYYILKKEQEVNKLKSQVGSSRPAVREYSLKEIKINLPNIEIQEKFSKIVEPLLNLSTKANKIEKILNDSLLKITKKLIV